MATRRERERESFIRNNLHNGVVSGAARGQALLGPMWAGLTPDSKGDPTGDTGEPDRRRQETPHLSARRKGALPASPGGPPSTGQKKLRVLNPILRLYRIQSTGKSFRMRVEMCWELVWQPRRPRLVVSLSTCPSLPPFPPHTALYQVLQ